MISYRPLRILRLFAERMIRRPLATRVACLACPRVERTIRSFLPLAERVGCSYRPLAKWVTRSFRILAGWPFHSLAEWAARLFRPLAAQSLRPFRPLAARVLLLSAVLLSHASCIAWRFIGHGTEGIDDYETFPTDTVRRGSDAPFRFAEAPLPLLDTLRLHRTAGGPMTLAETIDTLASSRHNSAGIVVLRNDTILFERYRGAIAADSHSTIFSISKSITSLLVGIALDRGYIRSVDDPVTDYLPELKRRDPRFGRLTVAHLLDMRTGLDFEENYGANPFSQMARLHYGRHLRGQIRRLKFRAEPGTEFYYSSMATALAGVLLEEATGRRYADLLSEWVWQPLGMERDALVNLDDRRHRTARAYGGISTNCRDLARFGRLYLHGGVWEGRRIVDSAWVVRSLSPERAARNACYTNSWRSVGYGLGSYADLDDALERIVAQGYAPERLRFVCKKGEWRISYMTDNFYALGVFGQVVFVCPSKNVVAVFLGDNRVCDYQFLFDELAAYL